MLMSFATLINNQLMLISKYPSMAREEVNFYDV